MSVLEFENRGKPPENLFLSSDNFLIDGKLIISLEIAPVKRFSEAKNSSNLVNPAKPLGRLPWRRFDPTEKLINLLPELAENDGKFLKRFSWRAKVSNSGNPKSSEGIVPWESDSWCQRRFQCQLD
jgi:hypothetical protein